jgi:hypothetical protein
MRTLTILIVVSISIEAFAQSKIFVNGGVQSGINSSTNSFIGVGPSNSSPTTHLHVLDSYNGELSLLLQNSYSIGTRTFLTSTPTRSLIQTDRDFGINTNGGGWSEKFTLLNNGNVGIGTLTPNSSLAVKGRFGIRADATPTTPIETMRVEGAITSEENVVNVTNLADQDFIVRLSGVGAGTKRTIIGTSTSNRFSLGVGVSSNNEYLTLVSGGNVGIGTTTPDAKLAVSGQVHAQEVKVSVTVPGPDYVFEKDYKLTSLEEIKNYIDQNKHLPEVPSAKEMEKNGVQLGEMNMLLLRKIEELTLYLIEQNKFIEQLKEERRVSPDPSGKKIEELTLYVIEQNKKIELQGQEINTLKNKMK